mmetsp:Transcript_1098/g.1108  ORF Transcript_1098/g.1108 Transcript_1098/m.1108 type:complete len:88 (+) Transcript_1098:142-405(+)
MSLEVAYVYKLPTFIDKEDDKLSIRLLDKVLMLETKNKRYEVCRSNNGENKYRFAEVQVPQLKDNEYMMNAVRPLDESELTVIERDL